jgi:hypothetical protein
VHSPAEEPNETKRLLEDQVQGLRDVITAEESRLYGLKGRRHDCVSLAVSSPKPSSWVSVKRDDPMRDG